MVSAMKTILSYTQFILEWIRLLLQKHLLYSEWTELNMIKIESSPKGYSNKKIWPLKNSPKGSQQVSWGADSQ